MKRLSRCVMVAIVPVLAVACAQPAPAPPPAPTATPTPAMSQVERGKYIVSTSACHDCHTPVKMGPTAPSPTCRACCPGIPKR
jgi:hypothetical protein